MTTSAGPDRPGLLSPRGWLIWGGAVITWGSLLFWYRYLGDLAEFREEPFQPTLIDEMTGGLVCGVLFFFIRALVLRHPLTGHAWRRRLPLYGVALVAAAAAATSLMWASRSVLYPLAGLGRYDYGAMPLRYFMELPVQTIGFSVMVFVIHAVEAFRESQQRQVRAAEVERALAQAQIRTLRLQLQPHFLFNALNTISSTMYQDPAAADEMIEKLADLLRASLRTTQADEVPLASEIELLDKYLWLMRARFGDRLRVSIRAEEGTARALVPSMMLQPLVENAVRHGNATLAGEGTVEIRARRDGGSLVVEVEDDGPGTTGHAPLEPGIGLSATAERLALLHGGQSRFEAGNAPGGGFIVRVTVPFRETHANSDRR